MTALPQPGTEGPMSSNEQRAAEVTRLWSVVTGGLVREGEAAIAAALDAAEARRDEVWKAKIEALAAEYDRSPFPLDRVQNVALDLRALVAGPSAPATDTTEVGW